MLRLIYRTHFQPRLVFETTLRKLALSLLLFALAYTTWLLVHSVYIWSEETNVASQSPLSAPLSPNNRNDIERLAALHLFGTALPEPPMPTSSGDIVVTGIVYAPATGVSQAILTSKGSQQSYTVGDALPAGERLVDIERDRVIFERNGSRYNIALEIQYANAYADFGDAADHVLIPQLSSAVPPLPVSRLPTVNMADTVNRLRMLRQSMPIPSEALVGNKSGRPSEVRTSHRNRVTALRDDRS